MNFEFYTLKNGVRVILSPMEGVESVGVGVYVGTGSRFETPEINGISHFLEHMAFKGTKNYPTHKETSYLEGLGAIQNAWTDVDATAYWCKIPADRWEEALRLAADLVINPTVPEKDLEIERGVILEEINRKEDRPDELVGEELGKLIFKGNPLGMTILGEAGVIKKLSRQDFVNYHDRQYVTGNIVVAIAGKINQMSGVRSQILDLFKDLSKKEGKKIDRVQIQDKLRTGVLAKKLANQAHIELAFPGVSVADPRRFALGVLTSYLGQGLSSRLFTELREKRGLCYAIGADAQHLADTGVFSVYAGLNIEKLEEAVLAIAAEIKRIKEVRLSEAELVAAKEKIRGPMLFAMENPIRVMEFYARQVLDRPEEILDYRQVLDKVMAVDAKEIQSVADSLFVMQKLNLAVVGPVDRIKVEKISKLIDL